jgi:hypothetical protein
MNNDATALKIGNSLMVAIEDRDINNIVKKNYVILSEMVFTMAEYK